MKRNNNKLEKVLFNTTFIVLILIGTVAALFLCSKVANTYLDYSRLENQRYNVLEVVKVAPSGWNSNLTTKYNLIVEQEEAMQCSNDFIVKTLASSNKLVQILMLLGSVVFFVLIIWFWIMCIVIRPLRYLRKMVDAKRRKRSNK